MVEIVADLSGTPTKVVSIEGHPDMAVTYYDNGEMGLRHTCTRPRDGLTLIVAPKFQFDAGHTLVSEDPVTISPSCGCSDCGLHGFIRNGRWEGC